MVSGGCKDFYGKRNRQITSNIVSNSIGYFRLQVVIEHLSILFEET